MRAAIYGRQSRDKRCSIEQQITEGTEHCAREGWALEQTYRDGSSASRFATTVRSDWQRVLADIAAGRLDVLILWESSRGDRNHATWASFLDLCRDHNVLLHVITHHRTYDMRIRRDWKTLAEEGVDSADEAWRISERTTRGVRAKALAGRPHGRAQYGYDRVYDERTGSLVSVAVNAAEAGVMLEAARRVLAGETTYSISQDFNARGIPTPRAGSWTAMSLMRVLGAPWPRDGSELDLALTEAEARIRAGETPSSVAKDLAARGAAPPPTRWVANQIKRLLVNPSYNGKRTHRGEIVADATWPPILDDVTYHALRAKLCDPARGRKRDSSVRHLVSGIARCGYVECGGRMRVLNNRGSRSYTCTACFRVCRIQSRVDWVVETVIVGFLSRPDAIELLAVRAVDGEVDQALAEIEAARAQLDEYCDAAAAKQITLASFARIEAQLLADIAAAENRVRRATVKPLLEQVLGPDAEARWATLAMSQKREVIAELVRIRILPMGKGRRTFDPNSIEITWRHLEHADSAP